MLARLMESQIWHAPASSVALLGKGSEKGQWPLPTLLSGRKLSSSSCVDARHFSSSLYATGAFQAATRCWSSEGVSLSKSIIGFFMGNCLGLKGLLPLTTSLLVFAARRCGDLSYWHWKPGLGGLVWGWDSLLPRYPSQIFIHYIWMWV